MTLDWPETTPGFCDLHENRILLYAPPKFGKTTLMSQWQEPLFIDTENGTRFVQVPAWRTQEGATGWLEFCSMVAKLKKENDIPFKTIVLDTVDNLLRNLERYICQQANVQQLGDVPFGKLFKKFETSLVTQLNTLNDSGLGLVLVSHAQNKTVPAETLVNPYTTALVDKDGDVELTIPTINDKRARRFILGMVDMILFGQFNDQQDRVLYCQPTRFFEAGDRSGRLPNSIPFSYEALVNAYYSTENGPKQELIDRIYKAYKYLGDDHPTIDLDTATATDLDAHLQELRKLAKGDSNANRS